MTEKEFRKLVTDLEISNEEKNNLNEKLNYLKGLFDNNHQNYFEIIDIKKTGSWAKGTLLNDVEEIDIMMTVKPLVEKTFVLKNELVLNGVINILIANVEGITKLSEITKNTIRNIISIKINDLIVNIHIRYLEESFLASEEEKQIEFTEIANRDYTYFRNTVKIIKYYKEQQKINISGYIIEILLYYALNEYFKDNRYEDYLNNFIRALDDFMKQKKIEVSHDVYQKLNIDANINVKKNYMILDVSNPNNNLTDNMNELLLGEYRKLKKTISKLIDTRNNFSINSNTVVTININPIKIKDTEEYAWSYKIENSDYSNSGGSYQNTTEALLTAMYKALYKALRTVVDNNLNKKKVEIISNKANILKLTNISDENKSRIKTIESYIENNGLVVIFK